MPLVEPSYLDEYLRIREVPDERNAVNGLRWRTADGQQHRGGGGRLPGHRRGSPCRPGSLLIVHHGLFWDGNVPVTGRRYRRLWPAAGERRRCLPAHIPLDLHPEVGNNVVLADRLGIEVGGWFGDYKGSPIGVWGFAPRRLGTRDAFVGEVNRALGTFAPGAPDSGRPRPGLAGGYHHGGRRAA